MVQFIFWLNSIEDLPLSPALVLFALVGAYVSSFIARWFSLCVFLVIVRFRFVNASQPSYWFRRLADLHQLR